MQLRSITVTSQWPPPNYVDPEVRGPALLVVCIILSTFVMLVVGLRIFTRLMISKCHGIDDALIVFATLFAVSHTAIIILSDLRFGGDRHIWDVPVQELTIARKLNLAGIILFAAACTLTKMSLLFFTWRILSSASRLYKLGIQAAIFIVTMEGVIFCFVIAFQCSPISQYWTFAEKTNCINENATLLTSGIINTLTDFVVVLIPIPTIWDLHLPRRQRIGIVSLFGVGILACSAGIARTVYTYQYTTTSDLTWEANPVWIASTAELNLGIICASVPAVKPLLAKYLPKMSTYISTRTEAALPQHQTVSESFYLKKLVGRPQGTVSCTCDDKDNESQRRILPDSPTTL